MDFSLIVKGGIYIRITFSSVYRSDKYKKIDEEVWKFFIEDIERHGFKSREGQEDMALEISEAIRDNNHMVVEAEVGIGKSFAYLVPLFYYIKQFDKPILIATSTIALQEQLEDDIQKMAKILNMNNIRSVVAKGQNHFICLSNFYEKYKYPKDEQELKILKIIKRDAKNNISDRRFFNIPIPNYLWQLINVRDFGYKCNICEHKVDCYYSNLRNKLPIYKGIIVCNQDLLTIDLINKSKNHGRPIFNKETSIIVIDEAHNLEHKVRDKKTKTISKSYVINTLEKSLNIMTHLQTDYSKEVEQSIKLVGKIFNLLESQIDKQIEKDEYKNGYSSRYFMEITTELYRNISEVYSYISNINLRIQINLDDNRAGESIKDIADNIEDLSFLFEDLRDNSESSILWLEKNYSNVFIKICPKDIGSEISKLLFNSNHITILTSATLTDKSSGSDAERYSYFIKNIGFPYKNKYNSSFISTPKKSPFPYDENTLIYVADDLPHPSGENRDAFLDKAINRIHDLLSISDGKSLILFTANSDMDYVYDKLLERELPYKIWKQGLDGKSHDTILEEFKDNENMVLLGSGSFSEGVNIEGTALSNLIIFKLPFPVPDPILEYKASLTGNPQRDVYVPEMIIKLKQAIGRLIRSETDKGIVCILDPRLSDKYANKYKKVVWDALPMKNKTSNIKDLKQFYDSLW